MIRSFLTSLLAKRFAFQFVLLAGLLVIGVNEYSYRTSMAAFRAGIALTDDRVSTARLLQALTDAEAGQRGYLLTQDAFYLAAYTRAVSEISLLRAKVVPFLDVNSELSASDIDTIIDSRLQEMSSTISLLTGGSVQQALSIVKAGAAGNTTDKFRRLVEDELSSAANRQLNARVAHVSKLDVNHVVAILLTLGAVAAMYVFIRQLRVQFEDKQIAQAALERTVDKRTIELRDLAKYLQTVRELEKDHLARELHDELGALLTVAKLDLEGMRKRVADMPELTARLERLGARLNEVIVLKRRMVEDMRPSSLTMLGLRATLEQHCRDLAEAMNIPFDLQIEDVSLAAETELVIFRFVQEALTNMAKYSGAKSVSVSLHKTGNQLEVVVSDDGAGFDADCALVGRHGLMGMRYRIDSVGGIMTVTSKPGSGTTVRATITV